MITFLSSPKDFVGSVAVIQRSAILSWLSIQPDVEVSIYGEGEGVAEACLEMGVSHVPDVPCSNSGVPYFNSIVKHAQIYARHDTQCYLNCDIMMTKAVINAVKVVEFSRYLIIGQRIDLAENINLDVASGKWKDKLQGFVDQGNATMHPPSGMDYFIFPKGLWKNLPLVVIGRVGYDDALVAFCLRNKIPLINGTLEIPVFHQFHDYGHVAGGEKELASCVDAQENIRLHRVYYSRSNSADAPWLIVDGALIPNLIQKDWLRRIELKLRFDLKYEFLSKIIRLLWRIGKAIRIIRPRYFTAKDVIESSS